MATTPVPTSEAQARSISSLGRVIGVFFSPKNTFEDIVRKPSWMVPIVLLTVLSLAVSLCINQRVNWREFMNQQIEKSPRAAQMSAEQKQQQIEGGAKFSPPFTYAIGLLGPILAVLVIGLVMWGAYSLLGGASTNFTTAFSITSHAFLTGLVSSPLFILVLYLKPYGTAVFENLWARNSQLCFPTKARRGSWGACKIFFPFSFWAPFFFAPGFSPRNPKKI